MLSLIERFIPINKLLIGIAVVAGLYIGYLELRIWWLKSDNVSLEETNTSLAKGIATRDAQLKILAEREIKLKEIQDDQSKTIKHLRSLPSGPVSDALRYAVEHDVVRP